MEVDRDKVSQEKWDELQEIAKNNVCAECGAELQVHTNPEKGTLEVGCLNRDHHGLMERETYTQAFRRGKAVLPVIQSAIERKMMPKDELGRAMNLLSLRYPDTIKDPPTAALFIMDCARLDIDPLISPAEAVPIPFKRKKKKDGGVEEKITVQMIITHDGWLSMAARGCKEDWVGPPRTMRLEEYLTTLPENKGRPRAEILTIASEIKRDDCSDENAWYYVAIGKRRGGEDIAIPGWFTHADHEKAKKGFLPAATQPGNQARVRATKKWVRKVFPECRQKMIELTAEWYQRAEGIKAAQEYIDAEYSFISLPEGDEKIGATGEVKPGQEKAEVAREAKVVAGEVKKQKQGATNLSSQKGKEPPKIESPAEPEGFHIDLTWLQESQKTLKWTDDTCKSFLVGKYKVSIQGTLAQVLQRLTREQAESFVKEINSRLEKQMQLFS